MNADRLREYLIYYQDLGIGTLYDRKGGAGEAGVPEQSLAAGHALPPSSVEPATVFAGKTGNSAELDSGIRLPGLAPEGDTMFRILEDLGDCRRCRLHEGRTKIVFGSGNEKSPLVFVGEGPGADEDAQGVPFVGRAGQLLTQMIENTARKEGIPIQRSDVYICNVVKCRPPGNRTPEPDEMEICGEFLFRQLEAIKPKAICSLGSTATRALLGRTEGVTKLRGHWHRWRDIPVMVTFHPSYLLRPYNQNAKREAWEDLKKVLHFVYD
jgi:uracil-DNA glycosylase